MNYEACQISYICFNASVHKTFTFCAVSSSVASFSGGGGDRELSVCFEIYHFFSLEWVKFLNRDNTHADTFKHAYKHAHRFCKVVPVARFKYEVL